MQQIDSLADGHGHPDCHTLVRRLGRLHGGRELRVDRAGVGHAIGRRGFRHAPVLAYIFSRDYPWGFQLQAMTSPSGTLPSVVKTSAREWPARAHGRLTQVLVTLHGVEMRTATSGALCGRAQILGRSENTRAFRKGGTASDGSGLNVL